MRAYNEGNSTLDATKVVRSKQYKYIRFADKDGGIAYEQFFDLTRDPWETKNLINDASYSLKINEMKEALKKWDKETEIAEPVDPPAGKKFEDDDEIPGKNRERQRQKK